MHLRLPLGNFVCTVGVQSKMHFFKNCRVLQISYWYLYLHYHFKQFKLFQCILYLCTCCCVFLDMNLSHDEERVTCLTNWAMDYLELGISTLFNNCVFFSHWSSDSNPCLLLVDTDISFIFDLVLGI